MRVYTLWHAPEDELSAPYLVDAVDEYTLDELGEWPEEYAKRRTDPKIRELTLDVPDRAVTKLFESPTVTVKVADADGADR